MLLDKYLRELVRRLRAEAGVEVVTAEEVDLFTQRFIDQRPPRALLEVLREFACGLIFEPQAQGEGPDQRESVIDYCLDIAAAAVAAYPYGPHERFDRREKALLRELMLALGV